MTKNRWLRLLGVASLSVGLALWPSKARVVQAEEANNFPWYFSPSIGRVDFEGDQEVKDAFLMNLRLGYDFPEWLSVEGTLTLEPKLDENFRTDWETGQKISRLFEKAGVHDTYAVGLAVDGLYHFTRWERLDPYLTLGAGLTYYADDMGSGSVDPAIRVGAGVMYHFNDEWAVRTDFRAFIAGADTEANSTLDAGVVWTWGARTAPSIVAVGGPVDSDGDGLIDTDEAKWKTDPYNPDTDNDGLTDGDEVHKYHTDPLNPDTDFDGLRDGYDEVLKYNTNPLERDTDKGGVADGHEVIEDHTEPSHTPQDDLVLFELNIEFDYDKSVVKPQYFHDLDTIGKVLKRNPGSTARIEGHADKLKNSKAGYNKRLSQRRAAAVVAYIAEKGHIEKGRMEAVGYGFERPKALNDPIKGNPVNRRVEVYIRNADAAEKKLTGQLQVEAVPAPAPAVVAPEAAPATTPAGNL